MSFETLTTLLLVEGPPTILASCEPSPLKLDAVTIPVNVACPVATWFASIVTPVPTTILSVVTSTFAVLNVVAVTTPAFPNFIILPTSTKSSTSND